MKVLFWVAEHPDEGDDKALSGMQQLGITGMSDVEDIHNRTGIYAAKFLGRILGRIKPQ
jgi:hypothetical protein